MKRLFKFMICLLVPLLFSGCYDYREINDTAMVAGIAVDKGETAKYKISVEIIQPAESESSTAKGKVLSESGNSAEDCLKRLVNAATKELQFSHCKLIVFSDDVAKEGISSFIDYFLRDSEYRPDLYLAVALGKYAGEMLGVGEKEERICSYDYAMVIQNSYQETGSVPPTKLYQFPMDGGLTLLPAFSEKDDIYSITSTVGFREGMKYGEIDLSITQSILLVSGEYRKGELQLHSEGGVEIPCQIQAVQTKKKITIDGDFIIHVSVDCDILLTTLPNNFDISSETGMEETETNVERLLTEKIKRDWENSVSKGVSEFFGLEIYGYRHKPRTFAQWNLEKGDGYSVRLVPHCSVELANFGLSDERISGK